MGQNDSEIPSDAIRSKRAEKGIDMENIENGKEPSERMADDQSSTSSSCESGGKSQKSGNSDSRQAAIESFYKQASDYNDTANPTSPDDERPPKSRWMPWTSWTPLRTRKTFYGVLSSIIVLTVRLLLDHEPTAYLIHSIVIFIDMFLIHMFTNSTWLSITGECLTILFVLAFHVTKETVYELLETTLIAALCSFHMILARNKHQDRVAELEDRIEQLKHSSVFLLQNLEIVEEERIHEWEDEAWRLNQSLAAGIAAANKPHAKDIAPLHVCGEKFFEHFLDGSAGVMYTSFLGLIINELLFYGESKK